MNFRRPVAASSPVRTSRAFIPITLAVVAFLAAVQVIVTEAEGDQQLLRDLSAKVAEESSAGVSAPIAAAVPTLDASQAARSTSEIAPLTEPSPEAAAPALDTNEEPGEPEAALQEIQPEESLSTACRPVATGEPYCTYTVQDGDTLSGIAETLDLAGSDSFSGGELLAMSNGINDAQNWLIQPGQELRVPMQSGVVHTVGESESLSFLAEMYGVTTADVIAANTALNPDSVPVGAILLVPSPSLWPVRGPAVLPAETAEDAADEEEDTEAGTDSEADGAEPEDTADAEDAAEAEDAANDEAAPSTDDAGESADTQTQRLEEPPPSAGNENPSLVQIRDRFAEGYIAAGGPPEHLDRLLQAVIPCESGYNLRAYNPAGPFYGLMQFHAETWARSGGGDWFDAYQQGANTGRLLLASNPTTQWPSCWR